MHSLKLFPLILLSLFGLALLTSCQLLKLKSPQSYEYLDERQSVRFVFYNVENLFDTLDHPEKNDDEFTPAGRNHWTSYRYYTKLQRISKVMLAIGEWQPPELFGLCEIENRLVLDDLLRLTPLSSFDYEIVHKESPDLRGIDVALFYRKKHFKLLFYDFFEVRIPEYPDTKTRDILYAKGILKNADTLHIFINHWPSRFGGKEESDPKRLFTAKLLRSKVDSILKINNQSLIFISGDFNDEPTDKSIIDVLNANGDTNNTLYNLMYDLKQQGRGSYKYKFEYNLIDQIIVSSSFFQENSKLKIHGEASIFEADWLMEDDKNFPGKKPFRTYIGMKYNDGYSDHLPVYTDIILP